MPFAYMDLDLLDENIKQILKRSQDKPIRVASKSIRSVEILKYILQSDQRFQGVLCFTIEEALFLSEHGLDDLLVAYPAWNEQAVKAVLLKVRQGKRITLMIDSAEHVRHLEQIASRMETPIPVCMDVDMSIQYPAIYFGVYRSSSRTLTDVKKVIETIKQSACIQLAGLMGYEAQIAGVADRSTGKRLQNQIIKTLKAFSIPKIQKRRTEMVDYIKQEGFSLRFVNGGGTGSIASTVMDPSVTEVTVGSAFYAPILFDYYRDFQYAPAAGFAIEITRQPQQDIYTCLGGGYPASGSAGVDKLPQPHLPAGASLIAMEGAGEVQTPIRYHGEHKLQLGDPIFMRHSKAGELCERFQSLYLIRNHKVVDEVKTYRGEGQCFL
ncbi:amino acid deaminase/aldolase [Hazenella sp. IB182357]|uniref:Amino acid deaminase/aldolase n=2 Tax=Polycladospora coralii TaxID=2771432 RepID=A0A926NEC4_9BACL|nr:amino acid deaminase/aldolase [Polycladospora coralii]MBS7529344.1 amino acid deaminase/aldolase [Polycladospora coralii]